MKLLAVHITHEHLQATLQQSLASFMLQDLRRYAMFDSSATRPYTVSAMACWARAQQLGYISLDKAGKVRFCTLLCPAWPAVVSSSIE